MPFPYSLYEPKAFPLVSRNCTIGIGPEWCGGDPVEWVYAARVAPASEEERAGPSMRVTEIIR